MKQTMKTSSRILIKCSVLLCLLGSSSHTQPSENTWLLAGKRDFQPSSNSLLKLPTAWMWILLIQDQCCAWEQHSTKYIWSCWSTQLSPQPNEIHYFGPKQLCCELSHWHRHSSQPACSSCPQSSPTPCSHTNSARRASPRQKHSRKQSGFMFIEASH